MEILLTSEETVLPVDAEALTGAVAGVLREAEIDAGEVSLAVVGDATILDLNRRYLQHDWPTDVLSFVLERQAGHLEGEIVASAETAARAAGEHGWSAAEELLLYVIHGALHLTGYRDDSPEEAARMRRAETRHLEMAGVHRSAEEAFGSLCEPTRFGEDS